MLMKIAAPYLKMYKSSILEKSEKFLIRYKLDGVGRLEWTVLKNKQVAWIATGWE